MVRLVVLFVCACTRSAPPAVTAPPAPPVADPAPLQLSPGLQARAEALHASIGVVRVDDLASADVGADHPRPQESVFKLWVAIAALDANARGELDLDARLTISKADLRFGWQPIAEQLGPDGGEVPIRELLRLMITRSDNPSVDAMIRRLGGLEVVGEVLHDKGIDGIVLWMDEAALHDDADELRARAAASPDAIDELVATAEANRNPARVDRIALALARLARGELLPPEQTTLLLDLLRATSTGQARLPAGAAGGWTVGHKTGTGFDLAGRTLGTNDVGLLFGPDGERWAVAVLVSGTDAPMAEREALIADVARELTSP